MSDIAELERRIAAALERIDAGLDALAVVPAPEPAELRDEAEILRLTEALEAERAANAQLTERVRAIREKQDATVGALEGKLERLTGQLNAATEDVERLKRLNGELAESNRALGAAAEAGVADPGLIDRALRTELDALRAARQAEIAEMDDILAELKPLIGEVA
jgi:DNA repair exonuclease SbcCD ATPase subunit